jgi:hypothetical protein
MRYQLAFEDRPSLTVVSRPCELTPASIEEQSTRLRSWALIRGAPIAGPAFVAVHGRIGGRVCLPLGAAVYPHPETGLCLETIKAGEVARIAPVSLGQLFGEIDELTARLSPDRPLRGCAEFHPVVGGRGEATLVLPLERVPAVPPVELVLGQAAIA